MRSLVLALAAGAAAGLAACERSAEPAQGPAPAARAPAAAASTMQHVRPGSPQAPIADQLIANERNAWATYAARNVEANGRLLAPDYRDVQPDGSVLDRAGHLAFVPEANLESHELDRFNVFLLNPETALVTYRARSRDRGSAEPYEAAVTSGWALRDGGWVNVFYREVETVPG